MAVSYEEKTGNGSTHTYTFTFDYILKDHVKLFYTRDILANTQASTLVAGTDFNWTAAKTIQLIGSTLNSGTTTGQPYNLPSGTKLMIERQTPDSAQISAWQDGSNLTAEALNNADLQNLYVVQENEDILALGSAMSIASKTASDTATTNVANLTATQFNRDGSAAMTGDLDVGGNKIENLATPTATTDAVTKAYSDLKVKKAGDTMSGDLAMGTNKVTGVGDPTANQDAATKKYVDDQDGSQVSKSGDTMSGDLAMGTKKVTGVGDPTANQDAATKKYVDDQVATQVAAGGDTMSGDLAMGTNKVTGLGTPSAAADAATKGYADTQDALREPASAKLSKLAEMAQTTADSLSVLTNTEVAKLDDLLSTTAELNKVNGFTGSSTDLNKLHGLTATQANLDITSGMSKETSLTTTSDTGFPTSKAVADHVKDIVDSVGGFKVVADKDNFPASHPDPSNNAGMVLSITNPTGLTVSSGTSSNGTREGVSDTVTITGIPTDAGTPLTNNYSMLVQTTTTEHTYAFYRFLAKDSDVLNLSDDIQDFGNRYRVVQTLPAANDSSNHNGDLVWAKGAEKMYVYNGDYNGTPVGAFEEVQSIGNFYLQSLTFDGSAQDFTIANPPTNAYQIILSINGVIQKPNIGSSTPSEGFALDGSTLKLGAVLPAGTPNFYIICGSTVNIGTPSAATVDATKLDVSNSGQNGQVLSKSATTEGLTWVDSSTVGGATGADFNDNVKARFGTGNDFEIYHDGTSNVIEGNGTADIVIKDSSHTSAIFDTSAEVQLFYDNAKKAETVSGGFTITGVCTATSFAGDGSALTGVSSAEVYGFNTDASSNLIVTTTNGGADNISASAYAAFEDTVFAATGISFSINASGNLIATIS
jgi:hypothetical protein